MNVFCNGDFDRKIEVKCYDWDSDGQNDLIGTFITTLNDLQTGNKWGFINPKKMPGGKKAKKGYVNSGVLHKMSVTVEKCDCPVFPRDVLILIVARATRRQNGLLYGFLARWSGAHVHAGD